MYYMHMCICIEVLTETGNILQRVEQTIHHITRLPNVF